MGFPKSLKIPYPQCWEPKFQGLKVLRAEWKGKICRGEVRRGGAGSLLRTHHGIQEWGLKEKMEGGEGQKEAVEKERAYGITVGRSYFPKKPSEFQIIHNVLTSTRNRCWCLKELVP